MKKKQEDRPLAFVGNDNGNGNGNGNVLRRNTKTKTKTLRNDDDIIGNDSLAFSGRKGEGEGVRREKEPLAFVGNDSDNVTDIARRHNKLRNAGIIGNDLLRNNKSNNKTTQRIGMGGQGGGYHHQSAASASASGSTFSGGGGREEKAPVFVYQKGAKNINKNNNIPLRSKHNNCTTAVVRSSLPMPASCNQSSHTAVFAPVVEEPVPLGLLPPPNKPHAHTFHRLHRRSKSMSTPNLVTVAAAAAATAAEESQPLLPPMDDINLLNNLGMLVPMKGTGDSVSTMTMKRSKSASDLIVLSSTFSTRLMKEQHLLKRGEAGRDPLLYYEIQKTLGTGSMGSVALVKKRSQAIGGSARKKVRDTLTKHKRNQQCFALPFGIGGLFRLCLQDSLRFADDDDDDNNDTDIVNKKKNSMNAMNNSWWATSSSNSDTSVCTSGYSISTRDLSDATRCESSFDNEKDNNYDDNYDNDNATNEYNAINSINHHHKNNNSLHESFGSKWYDSNGSNSNGSSERQQREHLYAMKSIHFSESQDDHFVMELQNEIEILQKLDHPNIVKAMETFQYQSQIYIIMEVCRGGDLYSRDPYSEEDTARIIHAVLSAVSYMHACGVAHRDLKYENILFVDDSAQSPIKLIDFGLSKIYGRSPLLDDDCTNHNNTPASGRRRSTTTNQYSSTMMSEGVGTIYTMAPEVLQGSYTQQADVWSIGVIAYMLLSSQMPFHGRTRTQIVEQILKGDYDFRGRRWKAISESAKDFVCDLLVVDPHARWETDHALSCVWLNEKRMVAETLRAPHPLEETQARKSMTRYAGYTKLKKMALMVVAHRSTQEEIGILRKLFQHYTSTTSSSSSTTATTTTTHDTQREQSTSTGCISYAEFCTVWNEAGVPPAETKAVFDACDLDGSGTLAYTEFLAATMGEAPTGFITEERLAEAFDRFDTEDSGTISVENLAHLLGTEMPRSELQDIIADACTISDNDEGSGKAASLTTCTSTMGKGGRQRQGDDSTRRNRKKGNNSGGQGNTQHQHQHISYSAFLALWERKNNEQKREVVLPTSTNQTVHPTTLKKLAGSRHQEQQQYTFSGVVVPTKEQHHRHKDEDRPGRRRHAVAAPLA